MSSTARKADRNPDDYYVTPHWIVEQFLAATMPDAHKPKCPQILGDKILDPSAGGCDKYPMTYPTVLNSMGLGDVETWDIREDSRAEKVGIDFLQTQGKGEYSTMITNPPFSLSEQFVYKALEHVSDFGLVIMLQRLNWLGTKKRFSMWHTLPLHSVFVHHKRPGFNPEKPNATDSIEYAHFVFCKNQHKHTIPNLFVI